MKKIIIVIFNALLLLPALGQEIPAPKPHRLVQDFYEQISDEAESELEQLLVRFNDSTSIEMAVVTMEDIGYNSGEGFATKIGNTWGVGKKAYDNGIVILVSFKGERAWGIATGRGIDQYLTDTRAGRIGAENLVPRLKAGEVDSALLVTVQAIINHLGWDSWEKREYWREWNEENESIKNQYSRIEAGLGFGGFLTWLVQLALLGFIIWSIRRWQKDIGMRKQIRRRIKELDEELANMSVPVPDSTWPKWAIGELSKHGEAREHYESLYDEGKNAVLKRMGKPADAHYVLEGPLETNHDKVLKAIRKMQLVKEQKETYEHEAIGLIDNVEGYIERFMENVQGHIEDGFLFEEVITEVAELKKGLGEWKKALEGENPQPDWYKEYYESAADMNQLIVEKEIRCNQAVSDHHAIAENTQGKKDRLVELGDDVKKYEIIVQDMKKKYPEDVWQEHARAMASIAPLLSESENKFDTAYSMNDKELSIVNICDAQTQYKEGIRLIREAESVYAAIDRTVAEQEQAKNAYKSALRDAQAKFEKADRECRKSHSGSSAKSHRDDAKKKMTEAERKAKGELVDWVALVALLATIKTVSESAYTKAKSHISDYNYHQNYSSNHSSSSSSSSSFSSFGGGNFGGGGAGGGW